MSDWEMFIPEVALVIWPGPYHGTAPTEVDEAGQFSVASETEFSVQCYKGKKPGPVHRFSKQATLAEVWEALADYRK
jgi:hypothetical protein